MAAKLKGYVSHVLHLPTWWGSMSMLSVLHELSFKSFSLKTAIWVNSTFPSCPILRLSMNYTFIHQKVGTFPGLPYDIPLIVLDIYHCPHFKWNVSFLPNTLMTLRLETKPLRRRRGSSGHSVGGGIHKSLTRRIVFKLQSTLPKLWRHSALNFEAWN